MPLKKELGVFILASGQNNLGQREKWGSEKQRFLVPVYGELLLVRAIRQVKGLGHSDIIVVTDSSEVQGALSDQDGVQVLKPEKTKGWVDTFLSSSVAWGMYDRVMILQADVIWSDLAIKCAFGCKGSPIFGGNPRGIVHFIAVDEIDYETVKGKAIKFAGISGDTCSRLLQEFCKLPWPRQGGRCHYFFRMPHDNFTADMDSYEFYERWVENHPQAK